MSAGSARPAATGERIAVVLGDDSARPAAGVERLRSAVFGALDALDAALVLTSLSNLPHYLERLGAERRLVVFAESPAVLSEARKQLRTRGDVGFCLFVSPTSFAGWGVFSSAWASGLEAQAGEDTVYLTDSAFSRAIVENHLRNTRADVRVLVPAAVEGGTWEEELESVTGFAEMKSWAPGEPAPRSSGTNWDFSARESVPNAAEHSPEPAEGPVRNIETLRDIFDGRPLEGDPIGIGILGHKLTFIDELARDLGRRTGSAVELDEWKSLGAPSDVPRSRELLTRSDVLVGEWGRPNNVWIQRNAPRDKRLIVRVHRYEVTTDFPFAIDMERFAAGVVIVPWVGRALVQKFGWPAEKIVYIPNYVNSRYYRRPKLPGAEFTLGIVGITPDLKRLDLALDLLAALRSVDLRYSLRVRGQLPTEHLHWATNPRISEQWGSILFRLRTDPMLRNAVAFDEPGRDMAAWFEGIGVILSTSDLEGSHVALAEGVASGALPIARPWPGVRTLWPEEFVFDSIEAAAERVLRARDPEWRRETLARTAAHPSLDPDRVIQAWWDLVRGDMDSAQAAFGPVDWSADWYEPTDR